jgi:hypothetical protein
VIVPPTLAFADIALPLADLLAASGREAEARSLYEEALSIYRAAYPANHPRIAEVAKKLSSNA